MELKEFEITYNEGNVINKKIKVEADTKENALVIFYLKNSYFEVTNIEEVKND